MSISNRILIAICMTSLITAPVMAAPDEEIVPIVFHKDYDIGLLGIEKLHPFDTQKYGKVAKHLQDTCNIHPDEFQRPTKVTDEELLQVHTQEYLDSLKKSSNVARVAEVAPLKNVPNALLQRNMLNAMRYATNGTIMGAELALKQGWAINLAGGYHHAKAGNGEGFCFFADIPLAIRKVREDNPNLRVLVVDLDAHQGNGLESILGEDKQTFIFDMYSRNNYPRDRAVFKYIDFNHPMDDFVTDKDYLKVLNEQLPQAIEQVKPDLIIYNAGTDIFENDQLGRMRVTREGIIERDLFVFTQAQENKTPILMVLSGGYSKESAEIVGASIENIIKQRKLLKEDRPPVVLPYRPSPTKIAIAAAMVGAALYCINKYNPYGIATKVKTKFKKLFARAKQADVATQKKAAPAK